MRFISLFDEKVRDIQDDQYLSLVGGKPIAETDMVLVEFELRGNYYKTHPIVIVSMTDKHSKPLTVKKLHKDEIISAVYTTAIGYINKL